MSRPSSELKVLPKLFSYPYGLGKAAAAYCATAAPPTQFGYMRSTAEDLTLAY